MKLGVAIRSAIREVRYILSHPARDARSIGRFVEWQGRCVLRRPALVTFSTFDVMLFCPAERRGAAKLHFTFREHYELELASVGELVSEGDSVIDVGAHHGAYTVVLARLVGPSGHVLAIEPSSRSWVMLKRNIDLNGLRNVEVRQTAVSSTSGTGTLLVHADSSRNRLVYSKESVSDSAGAEAVGLVTLDEVARHRPVKFLKIDVEGAEALVLAGARSVLSQDRPIVQFEHNVPFLKDSVTAWDVLRELDYRMFRVTPQGKALLLEPPNFLSNVVAIPRQPRPASSGVRSASLDLSK
jgi:FkbM family methyltransferase